MASSVTVECVHAARARLGEGAVWDAARDVLLWVDIDGGLIHAFDPARGADTPVDVGERIGCIVPRVGGGAVAGLQSGLHTLDLETGGRTLIVAPEAHLPDNRFNDAATDRQGRWWVGSMHTGTPRCAQGTFYRLDPDLSLSAWRTGFLTTNGLAFSPDGRTMYFSDSHPDVRTIWSAPYDTATGEPGVPSVFVDTRMLAGRPDGATVDADGCYWMAGVGGWQLVRFTPDGAVDMIVPMPVSRPTRPMFGGSDLSTLYVTSIGDGGGPDEPLAGGLFAVTGLPARGLAEARFAGARTRHPGGRT